ncbi:MAG: hypothetical protein WC373_05250 [Smithella sp.]|jgi:hypothetical protein
MISRQDHNQEKLCELHTKLEGVISKIQIPFYIVCAYRGPEEQNKAFAEGKSKLIWPYSNHNKWPARAVDIMPWFEAAPNIRWDNTDAILNLINEIKLEAYRQDVKLIYGAEWKMRDWSHIELSASEE